MKNAGCILPSDLLGAAAVPLSSLRSASPDERLAAMSRGECCEAVMSLAGVVRLSRQLVAWCVMKEEKTQATTSAADAT